MVAFEMNGCSTAVMIFWLMMMTGLSANSDFRVGPGLGEADGEGSHIASSHTSPDYSWFSSNRIVPEGMG